jgi:hypothetical protein
VTSVLTLTLPQPGRRVIEAKLNRSELKRRPGAHHRQPDWPAIVEQFAVSVGASLADPMVAKLVSPETLLDLLRDGKPSNVLSEDAPSVGCLSSEALKNLWRVYANSEFGIARFFLDVPVDKPLQDSFRLQFCLKDWTWRLCGLELPEPLQLRLAQEVMNSEGR